MIPTSSNRGLKESSTTPRLQTSLGKFSKLSTENRLLSRGTKSSAATEATVASLASKRRQELLSSLITEKRQKINLDLSNRLLNLNLKLQSKPSSSTEALGLTGLNLSRPEKPGTKNEPEQEDTEDIVAPTFLENLRDFPLANQESFHKTDPLLIQEKAHAEEQLIVKERLTRLVSISLVGNPNLEDPNNGTRREMIELCQQVSEFDPEFICKVS